jgi:hypothetical protein
VRSSWQRKLDAPRYSRERWEAAQQSWRDGEPWSDEWREWRTLAAQHGIPEAPDGSQWDQWDDDYPTERAQVIRAIRETPEALRAAILDRRTHSWASVVAIVVRGREGMRQDAIVTEERGSTHDPTPGEAAKLWARLRAVATAADRSALAGLGAGYCPTCKQALP